MVREKPYATNNIKRNDDFPFDEAFVLLRKLYFLSLNQVIVTHCGICFTQCLNLIFEEIEREYFIILDLPRLKITPSITTVNETGSTVIKCTAKKNVEPESEVSWETNNLKSNFTLVQGNDKTKIELHIHNASADDNGWLKCVAWSLAGKKYETSRFNVSCKSSYLYPMHIFNPIPY